MPRQPQHANTYEWQPCEARPLRFGRVLTAALVLAAGLELGRRTYFAEPSEFNRAQFNAQLHPKQIEPGSVVETAPAYMSRDDRQLALSASVAAQAPRTAEATPIAKGSIAGELQPKADERPAANDQRARNSAKLRRKVARPDSQYESRYARSLYTRRSSQQRFYASDDHALRSPIWPGYGGRP
ncbi:MAG: hypothetical protein WC807_04145 [Hyphomicrobium sp.]|jgi:hypothetical protein